MERQPKPSFVFQLLERFCAQNSLPLTSLDDHGHSGYLELKSGKRRFFRGTHFDLNPLGASEIADDKSASLAILKAADLPVPNSHLIVSAEKTPLANAAEFAEQQGYPVFLKPNTGQEGQDIERLESLEELHEAIQRQLSRHRLLLLQETATGDDMRILVLDGNVICAVRRSFPAVTGDGATPLTALITAVKPSLCEDPRALKELSRQGQSLTSVPTNGQRIRLLPNANLSAGGVGEIVTNTLNPDLAEIAARATRSAGLRYAGIDLIVSEAGDAKILEINAAPGLNKLAAQGAYERNIVSGLYERVFHALINEAPQ